MKAEFFRNRRQVGKPLPWATVVRSVWPTVLYVVVIGPLALWLTNANTRFPSTGRQLGYLSIDLGGLLFATLGYLRLRKEIRKL